MQEIIDAAWLGFAGAVALGAGLATSGFVAYHLFDVGEKLRRWITRQDHDD